MDPAAHTQADGHIICSYRVFLQKSGDANNDSLQPVGRSMHLDFFW